MYSQNEVKRLLEKVVEMMQERSEMVMPKVHSQLLKIADDRADAAEREAHVLKKEVGEEDYQMEMAYNYPLLLLICRLHI